MDSFFPSPYRIKNLEIRYKYKVFLFVLNSLSLKERFENWYRVYGKPENTLLYFGEPDIARGGYVNKLGGWSFKLPYEEPVLRKLQSFLWFIEVIIDWKFNKIPLIENFPYRTLGGEMHKKLNEFSPFRDKDNGDETIEFINSFSDFKKFQKLFSLKDLNEIFEYLGFTYDYY